MWHKVVCNTSYQQIVFRQMSTINRCHHGLALKSAHVKEVERWHPGLMDNHNYCISDGKEKVAMA